MSTLIKIGLIVTPAETFAADLFVEATIWTGSVAFPELATVAAFH